MSDRGDATLCLWDQEDGFFYDVLHTRDGRRVPLKVRSMVGLIPLFAVETLEASELAQLHDFRQRMEWFLANRRDLTRNVASMVEPGVGERRLLSIAEPDQLRRILVTMLDEREFLSPYGIRGLSAIHKDRPYVFRLDGRDYVVDYEPAESTNALFGGNSNWRGPVWFPVNYLLIESLQKFHFYFGDDFKVECPTGSGTMMNLWEVATELSRRLSSVFLRRDGPRAGDKGNQRLPADPPRGGLGRFPRDFSSHTRQGRGAHHP